MFFKSKSKKEVTTHAKVEKLSKDVLKNVIGGDDGTTPVIPDPSDDTTTKKHIAGVKYNS